MTGQSARSFEVHISNFEQLRELRDLLGEDSIRELVAGIASQVAETLRAQRDPETQEYPIVSAYPIADDRLRVEIEGTDRLHEFLERRLPEIGFNLQPEEYEPMQANALRVEEPAPAFTFLAHAHEDHVLALRIATFLHARGIRCFIDAWELNAGDSIRQKLESGLEKMTHFLALLTPASLERPWVKAEIDAGFIGMLGGKNRFVGIRHGVSPQQVGRFLETLWLPRLELATFEADMDAVANEILGVAKAPPVAPRPAYAASRVVDLSPAATQIAKYFVEHSQYGLTWDPQVSAGEMKDLLGMTEHDVIDAYDELKGRGCLKIRPVIAPVNGQPAGPTELLFVRYDRYWKAWDPAKDAVMVARVVCEEQEENTEKIMQSLGWDARRMNPALAYLLERDLVMSSESISHPLKTYWIKATDATRRFLKQAS